VIPVNLLDESEGLHFFYNNGGKFDFNSLENGIFVKKVAQGGEHAYHPKYSLYVARQVNVIFVNSQKKFDYVSGQVKFMDNELKQLSIKLKNSIADNSINTNLKINELFQ